MPGPGGADRRAPIEAGKRTRVWLELTQSLQGVKERTWLTASNLDPSPTHSCAMQKQLSPGSMDSSTLSRARGRAQPLRRDLSP